MDRNIDVLIVEDYEHDALLLLRELKKGGFNVRYVIVDNAEDMSEALDRQNWTLVFSDQAMPKFSAAEALKVLKGKGLDIPFIIVSGAIGEEKAVEMMKAGAHDFIMKNNLLRLVAVVNRALEEYEIRKARKLAEEQLSQTIKILAQRNSELKQFVCVASHDLKEPLRMVTSYLQLLQRRYKDKLDGDAEEFIRYAVEGASRMYDLISALLLYSSIESRNAPDKLTDCVEVINKVLETFKIDMDKNPVAVTHDELPSVKIDNMEIFQLFQNLIGNAIKFRREEKLHIHISAKPDGNCWTYSIRDNGIGIEKEYKEKIFIMFQRLHTREEYPGTGIGLSICKKIVEKHGGQIWVDSEHGKGSIFYFTLPNHNIG